MSTRPSFKAVRQTDDRVYAYLTLSISWYRKGGAFAGGFVSAGRHRYREPVDLNRTLGVQRDVVGFVLGEGGCGSGSWAASKCDAIRVTQDMAKVSVRPSTGRHTPSALCRPSRIQVQACPGSSAAELVPQTPDEQIAQEISRTRVGRTPADVLLVLVLSMFAAASGWMDASSDTERALERPPSVKSG